VRRNEPLPDLHEPAVAGASEQIPVPQASSGNASPRPEDDMRRREAIDAELAGVDVALRRLDDGTYGTCEVCGLALSAATMGSDPLVARCAEHLG
jgi:RNA polymerase-binding transcription factor DksA